MAATQALKSDTLHTGVGNEMTCFDRAALFQSMTTAMHASA
jgi:hypothetical protein